jgi:hypothetical protein
MKDTTHVSLAQQHSQNLWIIALGVWRLHTPQFLSKLLVALALYSLITKTLC